MEINKVMHAALKALSYPDLDVKKTYKIKRRLEGIRSAQLSPEKNLFQDWRVPFGKTSVPVRLFFPNDKEVLEPPVILFFHGGGWVVGDINSYTKVCASMAQILESVVISVDYRLAPEHKFPAAPEDCYHVAKTLFCDGFPFPAKPEEITLMGDSAGGNLAAVVSQMARDWGEFEVKQQILLYPATFNDHTPASPFPSVVENGTDYLLTSKRVCDYMELYESSLADRQNPYFAPLLAEDFTNQPRTLILTAEFGPLRDEGEAYGAELQRAGNDVTVVRIADGLHGYFSLPPRFEAVQESYRWIQQFLKGGEPL